MYDFLCVEMLSKTKHESGGMYPCTDFKPLILASLGGHAVNMAGSHAYLVNWCELSAD